MVCGSLTSCRKDLTTGVEAILRVCIKVGDNETKEGLRVEEVTGESLHGTALAH